MKLTFFNVFLLSFVLVLAQFTYSQNNEIRLLKKYADSLDLDLSLDQSIRICNNALYLTKNNNSLKNKSLHHFFVLNLSELELMNGKGNYDSSILYLEKNKLNLLKSNIEKKDSIWIDYQNLLYLYYKFNNDYNNAQNCLIEVNSKQLSINEKIILHTNFADLYSHYIINKDSSLKYINSSIVLTKKTKNSSQLALCYNIKGNLYFSSREYLKAYKAYKESEQILLSSDSIGIHVLYNNIGDLFAIIEDYDKAITYFKLAYKYAKKEEEVISEVRSIDYITQTFIDAKQMDSAYKYMKLLEDISNNYQLNENLATCYLYFVNYFATYTKDYDSAFYYLKQRDEKLKNNNEKYGFSSLISNYYYAYCFLKKNNTNKAYSYYQTLANYDFEKVNSFQQVLYSQAKIYGLLAQIDSIRGDYLNAYTWKTKETNIKDSIANKQLAINIYKVDFNSELIKQKEIDSINYQFKKLQLTNEVVQQKKSNTLLIYLFITIIILLIVGMYYFIKSKALRFKNKLYEAKEKVSQHEINSHFISNSLGVIQNKILSNELVLASDLISDFARISDYYLESSRETKVLLKDEIDFIDKYILFQQSRNNNFNYTIDIEPSLLNETLKIPPLIIQPFIENSIEHGFTEKEHSYNLVLQVTKKANTISIHVKDDGIGIKEIDLKKYKSYTYKIIKERILIFKELLKNDFFSLNIVSEDKKGTSVLLEIPFTSVN